MSRAYALLDRRAARAAVFTVVTVLVHDGDRGAIVDDTVSELSMRARSVRARMLSGFSVQAVAQDLLNDRVRQAAARGNTSKEKAKVFIEAVLRVEKGTCTYEELLERFYGTVIASTDAIYEIFMPIYTAATVMYPVTGPAAAAAPTADGDASTPDERLAAAISSLAASRLPVIAGVGVLDSRSALLAPGAASVPPEPTPPVAPAAGGARPSRAAASAGAAVAAATGDAAATTVPQPVLTFDDERKRREFAAAVAPRLQAGHHAFRSWRLVTISFGLLLDPPQHDSWLGGDVIQDGRPAYIIDNRRETLLQYVKGDIQSALVMLFNRGFQAAIWNNLTRPRPEINGRHLIDLLLRALDVLKLNQATRVGGKRALATQAEIERVNLSMLATSVGFMKGYG